MNIQIIISTIVTLIPIIIGGVWWLGYRFAIIDRKIGKLDTRTTHIEKSLQNHTLVFFDLISMLSKSGTIRLEDITSLRDVFSFEPIRSVIDSSGTSGNPLSQDEITRLKNYVDKAEKSTDFTPQEAKDFRELALRVIKKRTDEGIPNLLWIAAIILGIYYLSKK